MAALDKNMMRKMALEFGISEEEFAEYLSYKKERDKAVPTVSTKAPDFEVEMLTPEGARTRSSANAEEGIVISQHVGIEDRAEAAAMCVLRLNLKMPMALDDMSNQVEDAYRAWPDRLFVLNAEGKITYRSEQGPFGFIPDDWEAAINHTLAVNLI